MPKSTKSKPKTSTAKASPKKKAASGRQMAAGKTAKRTVEKAVPAVKRGESMKKMQNGPVSKGYTKSEIFSYIAEVTDLNRKDVTNVFTALNNLVGRHLHKKGIGEFTIPGLAKCLVKHKPATKARKGINPFTGEEMMYKAKPARNIVKIRALKKLKEMTE